MSAKRQAAEGGAAQVPVMRRLSAATSDQSTAEG